MRLPRSGLPSCVRATREKVRSVTRPRHLENGPRLLLNAQPCTGCSIDLGPRPGHPQRFSAWLSDGDRGFGRQGQRWRGGTWRRISRQPKRAPLNHLGHSVKCLRPSLVQASVIRRLNKMCYTHPTARRKVFKIQRKMRGFDSLHPLQNAMAASTRATSSRSTDRTDLRPARAFSQRRRRAGTHLRQGMNWPPLTSMTCPST